MDTPRENSLAGSETSLIPNPGPGPAPAPGPNRASNSRALKIAGITTLVCLLLGSQAFVGYMVISQRQQIHSLQKSSEKMSRQMTRSSNAVAPMRLNMPMSSLSLMDDLTDDVSKPKSKPKAETPLIKLQDTVLSVEKQLMNLMGDSQLPHFNQTFLANLQGLKTQMNETEWKSFESWMRYWLIFQMAQQQPPAAPTSSAPVIKTKCQLEATAKTSKLGDYRPQCDEQGRYKTMQCWYSANYCWCVDESGTAIDGTTVRGRADCDKRMGFAPRRAMISPMLMEKTVSLNNE